MGSAVVGGIVSLILGVLALAAPALSARQARETANLEADLIAKLPYGSPARSDLLSVVEARTRRWWVWQQPFARDLVFAYQLLAVAAVLLAPTMLIAYFRLQDMQAERLDEVARVSFYGLLVMSGGVFLVGVANTIRSIPGYREFARERRRKGEGG